MEGIKCIFLSEREGVFETVKRAGRSIDDGAGAVTTAPDATKDTVYMVAT
jgi:hypothetical protein